MTTLQITQKGIISTDPADIRQAIISSIQEKVPDYTANLPGTLIEDLLSTSVGCLVFIDQAKVDLINSIAPSTANEALLDQIGIVYGLNRKQATNGSAYVIFKGTPGFVIPRGFIISDGVHRFYVQEASVINSTGSSNQVYAVSDDDSVFDIPAHTITKIETSVRNDVTLEVDNLQDGIPGQDYESEVEYRSRLMEAAKIASTGTPSMIKTKLLNIEGVRERLLSVMPNGDGYSVIVGGGDPVEIANAIFQTIPTIGILKPSVIAISGIKKGNPTVISTNIAYGLQTGDKVSFTGNYPDLVGKEFKITYLTDNSFSIPVDTSQSLDYQGGLTLNQNSRNVNVLLRDGVDNYSIPFIVPLQQKIAIQLIWHTEVDSSLYVSAIASITIPLMVQYINNIRIGEGINLYEIEKIFLNGVDEVFNQNFITKIDVSISINDIPQPNSELNKVIKGDPQSYFYVKRDDIVVTGGA